MISLHKMNRLTLLDLSNLSEVARVFKGSTFALETEHTMKC